MVTRMRVRVGWPIVLLLVTAAAASARQRALTLDDIYDPARRIVFDGQPPTGLAWIDATSYAWPRATPGSPSVVDWLKVDAANGDTAPLFDSAKMEAALAKQPGVSTDDARRVSHSRDLVFNAGDTAAVVTIGDDLYAYTFGAETATRLTYTAGEEQTPSFSPDGRLVAFVRADNLFVVDLATARESALTTDGSAKILDGRLDWVYQEEIYGRGTKRAYWWSPDSTRIAFLRLDDTPVPGFVTIDHIPYDLTVEHWDYPKAGDPNPKATLGVARVSGGGPTWIDTSQVLGRRSPHRERLVDEGQPAGRLRRAEPHADMARSRRRRASTAAPRGRSSARRARRGSIGTRTTRSG